MDRLDAMNVFVATLDEGRLAGAGSRLGVRLFVRTTRQIRLTDAWRHFFEQCRQALTQLVDAERE